MQHDFPTTFTAFSFLAAAVMLWGGWMVMPYHLGDYFKGSDFAAIHDRFHLWIWTFRIHLFGIAVSLIALVALGSLTIGSEARVVVWPGVAMASAGLMVSALAAAFYYHHGAWGSLANRGKSADEISAYVESLRNDTEYVTCLVRFGRVFTGLGMVVLCFGLIYGSLLNPLLAWAGVILGLSAMALTMLLADHLSLYRPIFHLNAAWTAAVGISIYRSGLPGVGG